MAEALVIGAGPAGLMAAEEMARGGLSVEVVDQKPSVARKFLMAGKSGLNLTKDEPLAAALAAYPALPPALEAALREVGPQEVMRWAEGLGQPLFTGSSGRVFPQAMKASPLLRAWLGRLGDLGVTIRPRWRWTGWEDAAFRFETPEGVVRRETRPVVLALGGASWPRLGSDAAWVPWLRARGVAVRDFAPANAGVDVDWSDHMTRHFGVPLKAVAFLSGGETFRGEAVISARGLEGGGIYAASRAVRETGGLALDLLPDLGVEEAAARLARSRKGESLANRLRKALRLGPEKVALAMEFGRPLPGEAGALARVLKALPVAHRGLRPIAEAISSAGGVAWESLGPGFELTALPGVFVAGEMLDWEAPTGGYLLTACFATGRAAGRGALGKVG